MNTLLGLLLTLTPACLIWATWKLFRWKRSSKVLQIGTTLSWSGLLLAPLLLMKNDTLIMTLGPGGSLVVILVAYIISLSLGYAVLHKVDRDLRNTTWSTTESLRFWVGGTLVDSIPLIVVLTCVAIATPFAAHFSTLSLGVVLISITVGSLVLMFIGYPRFVQVAWRGYPLPGGPLRESIEELLRTASVNVAHIIVVPAAGGRIATAMISGVLPSTQTLFITDYLLSEFTVDEFRCVVAHEIGHVHHGHLLQYLVFSLGSLGFSIGTMYLLGLFITPSVLVVTVEGMGIGAAITVFFGLLSRHSEREADLFALRLTNDLSACTQALEKLEVPLRSARQETPKALRWLQTHPDLKERVASLVQAAHQ